MLEQNNKSKINKNIYFDMIYLLVHIKRVEYLMRWMNWLDVSFRTYNSQVIVISIIFKNKLHILKALCGNQTYNSRKRTIINSIAVRKSLINFLISIIDSLIIFHFSLIFLYLYFFTFNFNFNYLEHLNYLF